MTHPYNIHPLALSPQHYVLARGGLVLAPLRVDEDVSEGTSKVQGTGSIQTAGHKKSVQDSQLELVGSVQVARHKKSVQDSQLELVGFVQVASRKTASHESLFAANSFLQAQRFKASSRGTLLSSQGILEVSVHKNTWTKPEIAGSGLVQTTSYYSVAGEHEVEIAVIGAIGTTGTRKAVAEFQAELVGSVQTESRKQVKGQAASTGTGKVESSGLRIAVQGVDLVAVGSVQVSGKKLTETETELADIGLVFSAGIKTTLQSVQIAGKTSIQTSGHEVVAGEHISQVKGKGSILTAGTKAGLWGTLLSQAGSVHTSFTKKTKAQFLVTGLVNLQVLAAKNSSHFAQIQGQSAADVLASKDILQGTAIVIGTGLVTVSGFKASVHSPVISGTVRIETEADIHIIETAEYEVEIGGQTGIYLAGLKRARAPPYAPIITGSVSTAAWTWARDPQGTATIAGTVALATQGIKRSERSFFHAAQPELQVDAFRSGFRTVLVAGLLQLFTSGVFVDLIRPVLNISLEFSWQEHKLEFSWQEHKLAITQTRYSLAPQTTKTDIEVDQ